MAEKPGGEDVSYMEFLKTSSPEAALRRSSSNNLIGSDSPASSPSKPHLLGSDKKRAGSFGQLFKKTTKDSKTSEAQLSPRILDLDADAISEEAPQVTVPVAGVAAEDKEREKEREKATLENLKKVLLLCREKLREFYLTLYSDDI